MIAGPLRFAIIGCGQVVQRYHLPAMAADAGVRLAAFVDTDVAVAERLAHSYGAARAVARYSEIYGEVDAALVAVPPQHHAQIAIDLLNNGLHVLAEKPMALNLADGQAMVAAAQAAQRVLALSHVRRFFPNNLLIKQLLDANRYGPVSRFEVLEYTDLGPAGLSAFYVRRDCPGAGLLFDIGPHLVDLVTWWFGEVATVDYLDDNRGGVEAECLLDLRMRTGLEGQIHMSRLRAIGNQVRIEFAGGAVIEAPTLRPSALYLHEQTPMGELVGEVDCRDALAHGDPWRECYRRQILNFCQAVAGCAAPLAPGAEGLRSLQVLAACREKRGALPPALWEQFVEDQPRA